MTAMMLLLMMSLLTRKRGRKIGRKMIVDDQRTPKTPEKAAICSHLDPNKQQKRRHGKWQHKRNPYIQEEDMSNCDDKYTVYNHHY
jgi:hypothetical protein